MVSSASTGYDEYSAKNDVPSLRQSISSSSSTGLPVANVPSKGQSRAGYAEPSGRVW